ncbi:MAG: MFS transporter [Canibacter sp.]
MSQMFRSLSNRNYRVWFTGAFISNIGVWMQGTAQNWVVLTELTDNDATAVGFTMALQFGPQLLLVPITGSVADRFDRRLVQLWTRFLSVFLALALGVLLLTGVAEIWHLYLFALALGTVNAFDTPSRQAFVSDLVPRQLLPNAVGLNSASFNSARLIGPAVAGLMIAAIGSGWVFIVNGMCFVAVILSLFMVPSRSPEAEPITAPVDAPSPDGKFKKTGLMDGFRYVMSRQDLIIVFIMVFLVGTFGQNFPIYASTMAVEFGQGAGEFGVLSSVLAIGSLAGALLVARMTVARMRVVILSALGFGIAGIVAAVMPTFVTFAIVLIFLGLSTSTMLSTANGFVQTTTDSLLRGRVLSLYFAILMGGTPIGAPFVGWVADQFGPRWSVVVAGISGLAAALTALIWLMVSRKLRLRWVTGRGFGVTHIGRPVAGIHPRNQQESLTAPLRVLKREAPYTVSGALTPNEAISDATGAISIPGRNLVAEEDAISPDSEPEDQSSSPDK